MNTDQVLRENGTLLYNILSVIKRFTAYETMGKLLGDTTKDSLELSATDRI